MDNPDDLNASLRHAVEDEEVAEAWDRPHAEAFELVVPEGSLSPDFRSFEQPVEGPLDREQVAAGCRRMLPGNVIALDRVRYRIVDRASELPPTLIPESKLRFEQIVRNSSRYHKYTLGMDLREASRRVLKRIVRANARRDKTEALV